MQAEICKKSKYNYCILSKMPLWDHNALLRGNSLKWPDVVNLFYKHNTRVTWKMSAIVKYVNLGHRFGIKSKHRFKDFFNVTFYYEGLIVRLPVFVQPSCGTWLSCWHKRSFLTSNSLFLCDSQTGARIRPPPLPPYVHSPCTVFSSNSGLWARIKALLW